MKSRLLIIIGIMIAVSITYVSFAYNQEIKLATGMMQSDSEPQPVNLTNNLEPTPPTMEEMQSNLDKTPRETHEPTFKKGQFPAPRDLSAERDSAWLTNAEDELYTMGCDQTILAHLAKYSNLLDEEFDGTFNLDWISLPNGVSTEKFEWCVDFIYDKRLPSEEELDISLDRWENMCSGGVPQCFGTFDNGTEVRIQCPDYPWKCGVTDFDNYKEVENEN